MPLLDDEPDTADLRAKVARAWHEFARAVAAALPDLPVGARLELVLDPTATGTGDASYQVTVTMSAGAQLSARAVGNASLPEAYHLDRTAVADMVALGWSPPGVDPGSGADFGLTSSASDPAAVTRLSSVLTRTLRDIYGAPHPAFLVYLAQDAAGETVPLPPLGTARAVATVPAAPAVPAAAEGTSATSGAGAAEGTGAAETYDAAALREQVHAVVAAMQQTTPEQLAADADGDIGIRAGSAMVFVKVREDPPLVDVFSPVLTGVTPTEQLYWRLSELTHRMPIGRLYCTGDTVWASVPVIGRQFQASHLTLAVQVMTGLADELDDRLHGEFGGRRFFAEDEHPPRPDESARTGMYL